ncbi:MAG: hypothetical protein ACJAZ1_002362 [Yoonia sp.]|jgi:hypothetical protein
MRSGTAVPQTTCGRRLWADFALTKLNSIVSIVSGVEQPHLSGSICKLVHDWPLVHRDVCFRRRWAMAQCTVWSFRVVVVPPAFDDYLSFA